jgi:hypothetical protein
MIRHSPGEIAPPMTLHGCRSSFHPVFTASAARVKGAILPRHETGLNPIPVPRAA